MRIVLLLLAVGVAVAQTPPPRSRTSLEQLGYPAGTKLLIIHADDLASAHAVNAASFAALDRGAASSASIMVPCPWLVETAGYAKQHPGADLGLHLTFTSEWQTYRWGPVARGKLGALLDPAGYFWPAVEPVVNKATPAAIESELRAQVSRAVVMGIRPTHLDSHMGTLFTPPFFPVYVKVARECGIPFFAPKQVLDSPPMAAEIKDDDILVDAFVTANPGVKPEDWKEFYRSLLRSLKPGLTEMIVHLGYDNDELRAIMGEHTPYGSAWRQRDFEVITSPEFRSLLVQNRITVIGWKQIRERWPGMKR